MNCRQCGKEIEQNYKFCIWCGNRNVEFDENSSESKCEERTSRKRQIIRWIATALCSISGSLFLFGFWMAFITLEVLTVGFRGVFGGHLAITPSDLSDIYHMATDKMWMWCFVAVAVFLLVLNVIALIKKKKKKHTLCIILDKKKKKKRVLCIILDVISVFLSGVFVFFSLVFVSWFFDATIGSKEKMEPSVCLMKIWSEDEASSILKDLEKYGFYDPDTDYKELIESADVYPILFVADADRKEKYKEEAAFIILEDYSDDFYYPSVWGINSCDWNATVENGHVNSVYMKLNRDLYPFVEEGELTQNPKGNYAFANIVSRADTSIIPVIENIIEDKYRVDKEDLNFYWGDVKKDTSNFDVDLWKSIIDGGFVVEGKEVKVRILVSAKNDSEMEADKKDEIPVFLSYEIIDD